MRDKALAATAVSERDGEHMPENLLRRAEVATRLQMSERTLRRLLPGVMAANPALRPIQAGRTMLFTERDFAMLIEGLRCRSPSASAARSGTRAAPSASARTPSKSPSSAQDRVRELARKMSQTEKQRASETKGGGAGVRLHKAAT